MPLYSYQALAKNGKRTSGVLDATSLQNAREQLTRQGLYPVSIVLAEQTARSFSWRDLFTPAISTKDKIFFTKQLSVLLKSGIPLLNALDLLVEQTESTGLRKIIISLRDGIKEGKSLADGLAVYPKIFDTIYIQLIRAGEASGKLETILERLTKYLERQDELRKKVRGALNKPLIQLAIIFIITIVLLVKVVPTVTEIYADQKVSLPLATSVMVAISDFLVQYYFIIGIALALIIAAFFAWRATNQGAYVIDSIKLRVPVVKYFVRMGAVVQFCSTLGILLEAGVNLAEALDIVCKIVDNQILVRTLNEARDKIVQQGKVAEYLKQTSLFPPVAIYLINTGEQSGHLDSMLLTVAAHYETELNEYADGLSDKVGPAMLLIMAVVVGFVVYAVAVPLMNMSQLLQSSEGPENIF